jgi:glyoxylase-like metal-dependent hydrolase (beta-lactamase superfamily II)
MQRKRFLASGAAVAAALFLTSCATGNLSASQTTDALQRAQLAMGSADLKTLRYTASGTGGVFGQAYQPGMAWPKLNVSNLMRLHDYDSASFRQDQAISRAERNGGGGIPLLGQGEQRTVGMLQGSISWNMIGPAPVAAPVAADQRIHDLWTSPHGVLKAALKNQATASQRSVDGKNYTAMSFTEPGRFMATAFVSAQGLVDRVESSLPHPVMGDTPVVTEYLDYKDFGGVKFPARIRQTQGVHPVFDVQVSEVQVNQASGIVTPELVRTPTERAVAEKAAEGVWFIGGGSHNSVAIEMKDHIILVESPLYDGRASVVLAEVKRVIPGKPIRYVVSSHHHFDHSGGLRAAIAEGATVVASANAVAYYQRTFANANRISPDVMAKSGRSAKIEAVDGKRMLTDGARTVEIHQITDNIHAQGFLMVYLPAEKLLVQADAYTPSAPNTPPPATPNDNHVNLIGNIESLKLGVERILPLHGRMVPLSELYTTAGRKL